MEVEWTLGYALSEVHFLDEQPIGDVEELIENESDVEFLHVLKDSNLAQLIDDHIVEVVEELIESMHNPIEGSEDGGRISNEVEEAAEENASSELEQDEGVVGRDSEMGDSDIENNVDDTAVDIEHQDFHSEVIKKEIQSEKGLEQMQLHSEGDQKDVKEEPLQYSSSNRNTEHFDHLAKSHSDSLTDRDPQSILSGAEARSIKSFARQMRRTLLLPLLWIVNLVRGIFFKINGIVIM